MCSLVPALNSVKLLFLDRYDNRRRMGVEVLVLTMLSTPTMTRWELPEKYHTTYFVIDMLVSCRHRYSIVSIK